MPETTTMPATRRAVPLRLPPGHRGLVLAAMVLIGAGLALNWGWITAMGAAPLILSLAPCAVMCGAGALHEGRLEILREQEQSGRRAGSDEDLNPKT